MAQPLAELLAGVSPLPPVVLPCGGTRTGRAPVQLTVETDREDDGRFIAEVPDLPGVLAYGATREEAAARAQALALRVLADRIEHGEVVPEMGGLFAVVA